MAINTIIFDFGGVFYKLPNPRVVRHIQKLIGVKNDELLKMMHANPEDYPMMLDILTGRIPETEMWRILAREWHVNPDLIARLQKAMASRKRLNIQMTKFASSLRPRFRTAILSNAGSDARSLFSDVYMLHKVVDQIIISAEVGFAKPDQRIYQLTMDELQISPEEAIFIDDMRINIESARQFGLNAVHFQNTTQAIDETKGLLQKMAH